MAAEIKFLRAENKGLKDERDALKGQVTVLTRINEVEQERAGFYRLAAEKAMKLDSNNGLIVENLQTEKNVCMVQNNELEKENDKLRSSRNTRMWLGIIGGAGATYAATRK